MVYKALLKPSGLPLAIKVSNLTNSHKNSNNKISDIHSSKQICFILYY